jgi:hypothetical protein
VYVEEGHSPVVISDGLAYNTGGVDDLREGLFIGEVAGEVVPVARDHVADGFCSLEFSFDHIKDHCSAGSISSNIDIGNRKGIFGERYIKGECEDRNVGG